SICEINGGEFAQQQIEFRVAVQICENAARRKISWSERSRLSDAAIAVAKEHDRTGLRGVEGALRWIGKSLRQHDEVGHAIAVHVAGERGCVNVVGRYRCGLPERPVAFSGEQIRIENAARQIVGNIGKLEIELSIGIQVNEYGLKHFLADRGEGGRLERA